MTSHAQKVAGLHRLHESGCFVIPNPWDVGSARALAGMGFPALATTSSGLAWTLGRAEDVAANVSLAVRAGVAGLSVEDSAREGDDPLLEHELAVARVRAAREAIDVSGTGVLLTARGGWLDVAREIAGSGTFAGLDDLPDVDALQHRGDD